MNTIVLDDDLKAKLNGLDKTIEVHDARGIVVGQFVPQDEYMKLLYAWAKTLVTDEELELAARQTGGVTLREVLKRLGAA